MDIHGFDTASSGHMHRDHFKFVWGLVHSRMARIFKDLTCSLWTTLGNPKFHVISDAIFMLLFLSVCLESTFSMDPTTFPTSKITCQF